MTTKKFAVTALCGMALVCVTGAAAKAQMSGMDHGSAMATAGDAAGKSFDSLLGRQEDEIVGAAEAMPADKYDFAPSQAIFKDSQKTEFATVRSFGAQVRHIAQANYYFFGGKGVSPNTDVKAIEGLKTKEETVAALKKSFAFAHSQVAAMTAANAFTPVEGMGGSATRASNYAFGLAHMNDHYGQLVEYLRMNGIVPPASNTRKSD